MKLSSSISSLTGGIDVPSELLVRHIFTTYSVLSNGSSNIEYATSTIHIFMILKDSDAGEFLKHPH